METAFLTGVGVVTGHEPKVVRLQDVVYVELPSPTTPSPYIRLVKATPQTYTLSLSTPDSVFFTKDVSAKSHPDAVAAALAGLVYRGTGLYSWLDDTVTYSHVPSSEWPPGRVTSFALMLSLQTHTAVDVPFCRMELSDCRSVWNRADGRRSITTEYKADHLEVTDSSWLPSVTKVVVYPPTLTYTKHDWSCADQRAIAMLLRSLWKCLCA
jgi:hypothetical protein